MIWITRLVFVLCCAAVLGGSVYLSSKGVWGASASVVSVRSGTFGVGGRVK
ncbi:hypothetical protein [Pseudoponticoccus marisrubri]|uniref:hypothetical protein n=1 Tax=Pseudoponticoccus marisrubri TaxID=1685382 RepID=UPI0012FD4C5B|nr:hypothetical protein [Pseudoponticoccus marisrubri]